jgi:hypothetical protein
MRESLMVNKELAQAIVQHGFGVGESYEGITVVAVNTVGSGRWMEYVQLVIKRSDLFNRSDLFENSDLYAATYGVSLTENQVEPFGNELGHVEFKPVWKVTRLVEEITYQDDKDTVISMLRDGAYLEMYAQAEIEEMS